MGHKQIDHNFYLLLITKAAMTPGTHPIIVNIAVMMIDPHPLSKTANGGNTIHKTTRQQLIKILPFKK